MMLVVDREAIAQIARLHHVERLALFGSAATDSFDPDVAATIPDLSRIVAFRSILIHGYATVDDAIVWDVATTRLMPLIEVLSEHLHGA